MFVRSKAFQLLTMTANITLLIRKLQRAALTPAKLTEH